MFMMLMLLLKHHSLPSNSNNSQYFVTLGQLLTDRSTLSKANVKCHDARAFMNHKLCRTSAVVLMEACSSCVTEGCKHGSESLRRFVTYKYRLAQMLPYKIDLACRQLEACPAADVKPVLFGVVDPWAFGLL